MAVVQERKQQDRSRLSARFSRRASLIGWPKPPRRVSVVLEPEVCQLATTIVRSQYQTSTSSVRHQLVLVVHTKTFAVAR